MGLTVRPGEPADTEAAVDVWRLANAARREGRAVRSGHEERVRTHLLRSDAFLAIAEDQGAIVGMALGLQGLGDDGAGAPVAGLCHIAMVFVHPSRWGEGAGKSLVRDLLIEGRSRGFANFQLWTHADNLRAQRLYEGIGFTRSGRDQEDDLGDGIVHYELRGDGS
jgi:ribosomal protein S18 acetylase RimI-like enzyme